MSNPAHITLTVTAVPHLARLVRMTAASMAMLSNMSVERVEDIRMAAEEAFIYACSTEPGAELSIAVDADAEHVSMAFQLGDVAFPEPSEDDPTSAYADLILASVCDTYEKHEGPATLLLDMKADV